MNALVIQSLMRHFLTAMAGALAVRYSIDSATMDAAIGGLSAIAGIGWSIYDKHTSGS